MPIYVVFGVGIGNLGRRREQHRPMSQWIQVLNDHLSVGSPSLQIVGSFGHTGNFLAESQSRDLVAVTARFHRLLDTDWVVRALDELRAALLALAGAHAPSGAEGVRWTPGLAFHAVAGVTYGSITSTPRGVLWRISAYAIGVWKHDTLSASDTLDPDRRTGGWGGISVDIERQLGGQWTARSRRTIEGLIRMATDRPSVPDVAEPDSP